MAMTPEEQTMDAGFVKYENSEAAIKALAGSGDVPENIAFRLIQHVELMAAVARRVDGMPFARFVPQDKRTSEISTGFAIHGAPSLAGLYKPETPEVTKTRKPQLLLTEGERKMTEPTVKELLTLAETFAKAVGQKAQGDSGFLAKVRSGFSNEDQQTIGGLQQRMMLTQLRFQMTAGNDLDENATEEEAEAYFTKKEEELEETLAPLKLQFQDVVAGVVSRLQSAEELDELVPADGRTAEVSAGFAANNAENLARLFAPKP